MTFMRATLSYHKDYFLISEDLEECIFCKYNGINLPAGTYDDDMDPSDHEGLSEAIEEVFKEFPNISEFEIVYKFWGQLSASGYMDQTDYCLGDSRAEVADQLLELYFNGEEEYMEEDEKEDKAWLESIVKKEVALSRYRLGSLFERIGMKSRGGYRLL